MYFLTGIAVEQQNNQLCVAAVTWHRNLPTPFVTRGLTSPYVQEHALATIVVHNYTIREAVNTACHRTIERLLIGHLIDPGEHPNIQLLVKPYLAREHFMIPAVRTKAHWLLRAANTVITSWIRGER